MKVGIVGGGQLARMLVLAGYPLGLEFLVLDPAPDACAGQVCELIQADYDDESALKRLAQETDVVTFEFENVPNKSIHILSEQHPVFPLPAALGVAQDRLKEKKLFRELEIPTPGFRAIDSRNDLDKAAAELGFPLVIKTRNLGYDGKGQATVQTELDFDSVWQDLAGVALIAEQFVPFQREISIVAVRSRSGETAFYPIPENTHRNSTLHLSVCKPGDSQQAQAEDLAKRLLDALDYTGVMTLELFEIGGRLLANEIAPRVHNSGHWTLEGAEISQFENHLRAGLDLPLGSTAAVGYSAMVNLIGKLPKTSDVLSKPNIHFHVYGKKTRPGRKLGHATIVTVDSAVLEKEISALVELATAVVAETA